MRRTIAWIGSAAAILLLYAFVHGSGKQPGKSGQGVVTPAVVSRPQAQLTNSSISAPVDESKIPPEVLIEKANSDLKILANTPEFEEWKNRQPKDVQALGSSSDPKDAKVLVDRYTQEKEATSFSSR